METQCSLSLVKVWLALFCGKLCVTQEVLFNLKDPESNEVISLGQENVTLVCHVTNIENAAITISNVAGNSVAFNLDNGNCLEHNISRLTGADNGNYMCHVRFYNKVKMMYENVNKSLLLNVESGNQQCFRNGTSNQAFTVGDTLQLSCYCTSTIRCNWIRTVVGTHNGFAIPVYETVEFDNNKRIIRVIIGPVTSEQINERYDCYYGSLAQERCEIGPTYNSSNDFVLNAVDPSTILRDCLEPVTGDPDTTNVPASEIIGTLQRTSQGIMIPTTNVSEPPAENGLFLYIIIAGGVLLLLVLSVVLVIFITLKRNRKVKAKEQDREESFRTLSNSNAAYEESDDPPPQRGTMADVNRTDVSSAPLVNDYGGNRALLPDGTGYSDERQMGDTSHYDVSNAVLVNNGENHRGPLSDDVEYAAVNTREKMAEVSQYGVMNAVVVDAGDNNEEEEGFYRGEVTEYGVPIAFRADDHSDDSDVNRRVEDFDVQELSLRYS